MDILLSVVAGLLLGAAAIFFLRRGPADAGAAEAIYKEKLVAASAVEADLRQRLDGATRALGSAEGELKRLSPLVDDLARVQGDFSAMRAENARLAAELEAERAQSADKLKLLTEARAQLSDHFKALTADALAAERERLKEEQAIRETAIKGLVSPLTETLAKFDKRVEEMGKDRAEKDGAFVKQIGDLGRETRALVHALKTPHVKGRWGERTLRRTVELAGMVEYCDFVEQATAEGEKRLRPDLVVRMPAGRVVVVDAKAPTLAFLAAVEAGDEESRIRHLADHARQVREHFQRLSQKAYWEQFSDAPEFVVMFVPGESFFSAAVQADSSLLDDAANDRVLIATPTTLVSLLWAVERGWRQEKLAENARAISDQGRELFKRMTDMAGHFANVGDGLKKAVDSYNRSVGSLESRVFPAARKLKELGAGPEDAEFREIPTVESAVKPITKPELLGPGDIKH
jgi:DNA recombination protein RmuC